jgi:DNA-directed RNA polymerase specialized sigma subunit
MRYSGELTLREIGVQLRVNESRASQIHRLALIRLRQALQSRGVRMMSQVL